MNKLEYSTIKGIRNSLNSVRNHKEGDDWESYGARLQSIVRSTVEILDGFLEVGPDDKEEETNKGVSL